eukprot:g4627.t1
MFLRKLGKAIVRRKSYSSSRFGFQGMSTAAISGQGEIDFPIERSIREKLTKAFSPTHLEILNESHMHNVPRNSETHFKVVVISTDFDEVKLLKRHQAVNKVLGDELAGGVHALSIVAKTPEQWGKSNEIKPSPKCRGGSKA